MSKKKSEVDKMLRTESGAAVSSSEMKRMVDRMTPSSGDNDETRKQKTINRKRIESGATVSNSEWEQMKAGTHEANKGSVNFGDMGSAFMNGVEDALTSMTTGKGKMFAKPEKKKK